MRFDGTLESWNDDRGFGFIRPRQGGDLIFVHVSAFQRDGRRPKLGEALSFEVEPGRDGKKRALNVQRAGLRSSSMRGDREATAKRRSSSLPGLTTALIVLVIVGVAYAHFSTHAPVPPSERAPLQSAAPLATEFRCDGRTMCSQMTSCKEATFFLRNCPGTQMDGDHDGIPCERQWCTGPFAR